MQSTKQVSAPVLTFLTRSKSSSLHTQSLLSDLLGVQKVNVSLDKNDKLNLMLPKLLQNKIEWTSVASHCHVTGTIYHFLSLNNERKIPIHEKAQNDVMLTCITNSKDEEDVISASLMDSRSYLCNFIDFHSLFRSSLFKAIGYNKNDFLNLFQKNISFPLMDFPTNQMNKLSISRMKSKSYLREIVLPYFEYDDNDLMNQLSSNDVFENPRKSNDTTQVISGLYKWPCKNYQPVFLRPIPATNEDQYLASPSLIFQITNTDSILTKMKQMKIPVKKIGYSGSRYKGQLILTGICSGLEVRLCPSKELSGYFAEGEESLFAGSLSELQNTETSSTHNIPKDAVVGDCWMEVRAMIKQYPIRIWERLTGSTKINKQKRVYRKPKNVMITHVK